MAHSDPTTATDHATPNQTGAADVEPVSQHRTVVFTDVIASTNLIDELGDAQWLDVVRVHHTAAWELGRELGADHIKSTGDGAFAIFGDAQSALQFGAAMIARMSEAAAADECPLVELRVGMASGPVHQMFDDYHGRTMHLAARLCGAAGPNGVLVSTSCADSLPGPASQLGDTEDASLRGFAATEPVHRMAPATTAAITHPTHTAQSA